MPAASDSWTPAQGAQQPLDAHTSESIQGKPVPLELGPSLPPNNAERVATIKTIINAQRYSEAGIRARLAGPAPHWPACCMQPCRPSYH